MTWHLNKIPKIAHFFWDNRPLSFLRWMTLKSFSRLNPSWKMVLHVSKDEVDPKWDWKNNKHEYELGDYRERLDELSNLEVREEDRYSGMHGVHQSDILRNRYIVEEGGLWSDMDILFYRPMDKLTLNVEELSEGDTAVCNEGTWFPIAFMMGAPGNDFFQTVANMQEQRIAPNESLPYQAFGTDVYKKAVTSKSFSFIKIRKDEVYQRGWREHGRIFAGDIDMQKGVGIHWFGGSTTAAEVEPEITHTNWKKFRVSRLIRPTLKD